MKRVRNAILAGVLGLFTTAGAVSAQVIKQVPSNAWAVFKVSKLDATSKKIADLAATMGLVQMDPDLSDPLGSFLKSIGAPEGVDRTGDLAFAYLDPKAYNAAEDKSALFLLPVSDYQKFIANFPDAKPDGDLTDVHFKGSTEITYLAHWGGYVAASPMREIVAKAPTDFLQVDGLTGKELDSKDFVIYANFKALRPTLTQKIAKAREEAPGEIDRSIQNNPKLGNTDVTKFAPVAKVVVNELLDLADRLTQDTNAATYAVNISPDGIGTTAMGEFQAETPSAKTVARVTNTDASLLGGLTDGKYLFFGGGVSDPKLTGELLSDFVTPIETAVTGLGPDYASVNDWINAIVKGATLTTGQTFGLLAPTAPPGQGSLVQFVAIRRGEAKGTIEAMQQTFDAQQAAMKSLGVTMPTEQKYIKGAKTLDGVTFDELQTPMNPNGQTPQEQQMAQVMMMVYGPQGPSLLVGAVNDQTVLYTMGLDDTLLSTAIGAAKGNDDPLAKSAGVKTVAAELPAQRFAAVYIPLDLWASTGLGYAKQFGMDMGVTLPDNLPPIGSTLSVDGTAVRADTYIPTPLIQAMTSAGIQMYMKMQAGHGPGGPGGGAGGGL